jgi:alkylhydroperoxidase family enzyme
MSSILPNGFWLVSSVGLLIGTAAIALLGGVAACRGDEGPRIPLPANDEAWKQLPVPVRGAGESLPSWARMLAPHLPRTTAAFLQLDLAQRTASPIPRDLRAAMRSVSARANRSAYALAQSEADARRDGVAEAKWKGLSQPGHPGWSDKEQAALQFAHKMTVDSDSVTDDEFAALVTHFGEKQAASMVLLMAYGNFQDRLLLCLDAPIEPDGPLPPVNVAFPPEAFVVKTTPPPARPKAMPPEPAGQDLIADDPEWKTLTYDILQERLETQRRKPTRLRVPPWDEVARNLPEGLQRPSDIIWYRIVFGYAPELAVPFELLMRTAGAEGSSKWDRIFGQSLFWVTTKAVKCPYCMGHCEMNWEVAGLSPAEIAARSRLLAGDDWSSFPASEQRAFAFARKLTQTPWLVSHQDVNQLQQDYGLDRAVLLMLNASRYHYMTRISNGFQLTLERENVFYDYWNQKAPQQMATRPTPVVTLLSDQDCWQRMPTATSGSGQPLPVWARAVAPSLPRTAAAMLQLDLAQRTKSPVAPVMRAKMRWVIAHANRCRYSEETALADLRRAGADAVTLRRLQGSPSDWPVEDREPLEFARLLTVAAPTIPDELFEKLRLRFGDKTIAAMVLLAAYGNFQDRVILGLNLPLEEQGPLPPVEVVFAPEAFQMASFVPPQDQLTPLSKPGKSVVPEDPAWSRVSYDELQGRLEQQRQRKPRLPVPDWETVKKNIPAAMAVRPTRIIWNLVCSGYIPELAVPWSIATRTMWAESRSDRVFEESLFWIQTRSIECNYCMGHCEMLLEVAGLDKSAVAERTRYLAGSDWSVFPPAEQRAYAYARKLSRTPWELTPDDYQTLEQDLGPDKAMATFWWLCRGLYMTRVSDGFQLPLERDNVFENLPMPKPASDAASSNTK